jgi:hypothetical protein
MSVNDSSKNYIKIILFLGKLKYLNIDANPGNVGILHTSCDHFKKKIILGYLRDKKLTLNVMTTFTITHHYI